MTDPALKNEDFVILQLLERTDCLDRERTLVKGVPFHQCGEEFLGQEEAEPLGAPPPARRLPARVLRPRVGLLLLHRGSAAGV